MYSLRRSHSFGETYTCQLAFRGVGCQAISEPRIGPHGPHQRGNIGLLKVAEKFDETCGFKFISYAVWWIRQSILQTLVEQARNIRLPLNQVGLLNKISKESEQFEQQHERRPTSIELSELLDIPAEKIVEALSHSGSSISMDAPFVEGEDNSLLDVLSCNDAPTTDRIL